MLELQNTLLDWFRQFCPRVFIEGEDRIEDGAMDITKMPLISFNYSTSDFAENTMMTFNVWTYSINWIECLSIENKMAQALPSQGDEIFDITSGTKYEYRNPGTGLWIEFDLADTARIAQEIWDRYRQELEYREIPGESRGAIQLRRGNPFTFGVSDPDFMIKRRAGNIIVRSFTVY